MVKEEPIKRLYNGHLEIVINCKDFNTGLRKWFKAIFNIIRQRRGDTDVYRVSVENITPDKVCIKQEDAT